VRPTAESNSKECTKEDAEYNLSAGIPKTGVKMTKRRIPGVDLRIHHVLTTCPAQCLDVSNVVVDKHAAYHVIQSLSNLCAYGAQLNLLIREEGNVEVER
jgi:hypothetical protein